MNLSRRQFLDLTAGAAALPAVSRVAWAQAYPTRPVRIVGATAAGGGNDIVARLIGQWLSDQLGRPFVVENRPGAAMNLGTEAVVRAPADGYTLLLANTANATSAAFYDKLKFDFIRDIAPVAGISRQPLVMLVNPSIPANTVPEFITYANANRGKINFGSAGTGTLTHVATEMFKMMTGIDMTHVPYRGGGTQLSDLLGGHLQVTFVSVTQSIDFIKAGKLRALAITSATRAEALSDIPTMTEFEPDYEASFWTGLGAPKNTPAEIIDKLNKEINAALAHPKIKAQLADLGGTVLPGSPADFGELIAAETEKWGKVIKFAGITAD
jgi:tripartite-type tricarboxylate transporter receptor subunit TctC